MNKKVKELLVERMIWKKNKKIAPNPCNKYVYKLAHLRPLMNSTRSLDERIQSIPYKSYDRFF